MRATGVLGIIFSCVESHIVVLALLSVRRSQLPPAGKGEGDKTERPDQAPLPDQATQTMFITAWVVRAVGVLVAAVTLAAPYALAIEDPLALCSLRVVSFFYTCKLLDLSLAKAESPPIMMVGDPETPAGRKPLSMDRWQDHVVYILSLLTQMRYHSFDIAVIEKGRPRPQRNDLTDPHTLLPVVTASAAVYFFDYAVPKVAFILVAIYIVLETLHTLFHPRCGRPLFYRPFDATSISAFWTQHWHQGATPFLRSLAYKPAKLIGGTPLGVVAAFSLSGVWHAWASMALVDDALSTKLGLEVWGLFTAMGVYSIVEKTILDRSGNGVAKLMHLVGTSLAFFAAAYCFWTLQLGSKIGFLRREGGGYQQQQNRLYDVTVTALGGENTTSYATRVEL